MNTKLNFFWMPELEEPDPSLIEQRVEEAIKPYFKLENVIRDLKKDQVKAREAAVRVLVELNIWLKR